MKKFWKIVGIALGILAVLGAIGYFWGKSVWDKIAFSAPRLVGLNFNGLNAADLAAIAVAGGSKEVTATVEMDVINKNSFAIPFSNLQVELLYNGQTIAQTSNLLAGDIQVPANGTLTVKDTISIILNSAGGQMLIQKLQGKKITVEYKIKLKVFGIPLPKGLQTQTFEF